MRIQDDDDLPVIDLSDVLEDEDISMPSGSGKGTNANARRKRSVNIEFAVVSYAFLTLFIALSAYFCYYVGFQSEDFINHPSNVRLSKLSDSTVKGDIISSDGEVLATTQVAEDGTETRSYPYGRIFAHAVGYNVNGLSGLELEGNFQMLRSHAFILSRIKNDLKGEKNPGDSVVTTINCALQKTAYDGLGSYRGAAIALDPETGKVLAMVSKPDFDPGSVGANWDTLVNSDSSEMLNRALQGLYPPGSTFKILTALEYLKEGGKDTDSFDCTGTYEEDDYTVHCYHGVVHGEQTFKEAFAHSCNTAFAKVGLSLKKNGLSSVTNQFLFNKSLPTELSNVKKSSFTLDSSAEKPLIMQTAIGQGETLVTPIHMAMIASAICNDGVLMKPYDMDHTQNVAGDLVRSYEGEEHGRLLSEEDASRLKEYMRYVITDGTGKTLSNEAYTAYGKTGTAEFSSNKDEAHSWFVGFAEKDGKKIAVAVIMEGAGAGSSYALPLAGKMFSTYSN